MRKLQASMVCSWLAEHASRLLAQCNGRLVCMAQPRAYRSLCYCTPAKLLCLPCLQLSAQSVNMHTNALTKSLATTLCPALCFTHASIAAGLVARALTLLKQWSARHVGHAPPAQIPKWVDALLLIIDAALHAPPAKPSSSPPSTAGGQPARGNTAAGAQAPAQPAVGAANAQAPAAAAANADAEQAAPAEGSTQAQVGLADQQLSVPDMHLRDLVSLIVMQLR